MQAEIRISGADVDGRAYLTWAPVKATIKLVDPPSADPVDVVLRNGDPGHGGQLEFAPAGGGDRTPTLGLSLPADGTEIEFLVAGQFPRASAADQDASLEVTRPQSPDALSTTPVMVRVRKDANAITPDERTRFINAFAAINDQGAGLFSDFRAMHSEPAALDQAHGGPGFLSWHRSYLLDLERELQKVDRSVTLPYWRFDKPAPNVFTPDFMGATASALGNVAFSPTNLLRFWQTDAGAGISRGLAQQVDVVGHGARVIDEASTLALGGKKPDAFFDSGPDPDPATGLWGFTSMEGDPHGRAHTSFVGWIRSPPTAPRDPLFFLLHCNVDRMWARWQWVNDRFDGTEAHTFFYRGDATSPGAYLIGHNLHDTMWPWDDDTQPPRPHNAPRHPFLVVPTAAAPGTEPTVGDMIDYEGLDDSRAHMGFCYDDVPYGR